MEINTLVKIRNFRIPEHNDKEGKIIEKNRSWYSVQLNDNTIIKVRLFNIVRRQPNQQLLRTESLEEINRAIEIMEQEDKDL